MTNITIRTTDKFKKGNSKMFKTKKSKNYKTLSKLHKDLSSLYTMTEIEQEAFDLCYQNGKDCGRITCIISLILDKFQLVLKELESMLSKQRL